MSKMSEVVYKYNKAVDPEDEASIPEIKIYMLKDILHDLQFEIARAVRFTVESELYKDDLYINIRYRVVIVNGPINIKNYLEEEN